MLDGPLPSPLTARPAPPLGVMFLVTLLSAAETYFVSSLGTDAIAAASLVVSVTFAARSSRLSVASWGSSGRPLVTGLQVR